MFGSKDELRNFAIAMTTNFALMTGEFNMATGYKVKDCKPNCQQSHLAKITISYFGI